MSPHRLSTAIYQTPGVGTNRIIISKFEAVQPPEVGQILRERPPHGVRLFDVAPSNAIYPRSRMRTRWRISQIQPRPRRSKAPTYRHLSRDLPSSQPKAAAHSTRIGAAHDLAASGIDLTSIMHSGGWNDPKMPRYYTRELAARESGMARMMKARVGVSD